MFQICNISFSYPNSPPLFQDFSLSLDASQNTILRGENGSGKSTLVNLMTGNLQPSKGSIRPVGKFFYLPQNSETRILGMNLMQDIQLWQISGWQLEASALLQHPLLQDINLTMLHLPLWELSTGTKSAYLLALALSRQDEYLILDEPFTALDSKRKELALELLMEKKGMLMISHQCQSFEQRFDNNLVLDKGKLI